MPTQQDIETNTSLLIQASKEGHIKSVEHFIPISNPKHNNSCALQWAAANGHLECVKLLIPVSDPKAEESEAFKQAVFNGNAEIVQLLIPVSDPEANNSHALWVATKLGYIECVQLLLPVSNYQFVVAEMLKNHEDTTLLQQCIDDYEAIQLKERILQNVDQIVDSKNNSVKRKL